MREQVKFVLPYPQPTYQNRKFGGTVVAGLKGSMINPPFACIGRIHAVLAFLPLLGLALVPLDQANAI